MRAGFILSGPQWAPPMSSDFTAEPSLVSPSFLHAAVITFNGSPSLGKLRYFSVFVVMDFNP